MYPPQVIRRAMGHAFLKAFGWHAEGVPPTEERYVLIAAPHTSNWDFPFTLALSYVFGVEIRWMGKHTLFEGPGGWFFKAVGGVPVERHHRTDLVKQMVDLFDAKRRDGKKLTLLVPAEGTRSLTEHWKSGFYHIAYQAGVPVIPGYVDFGKKCGGFGAPIRLTGDMKADMDTVRAFYADKTPKKPEQWGPVRLRNERDLREQRAVN